MRLGSALLVAALICSMAPAASAQDSGSTTTTTAAPSALQPVVDGLNQGLTQLDWLVVRDAFEVESATFWFNSPEAKRGEFDPKQIKTEIFLMPAAME